MAATGGANVEDNNSEGDDGGGDGGGNNKKSSKNINSSNINISSSNNNEPPTPPDDPLPTSPSSGSLDYKNLLHSMQESETVMKKPKVKMGRDTSVEDDNKTMIIAAATNASNILNKNNASSSSLNNQNSMNSNASLESLPVDQNLLKLAITFADQTEKVEFEYVHD